MRLSSGIPTPILLILIHFSSGCIGTTDVANPVNPCKECMPKDIAFLKTDPGRPNSIDATSEALTNDPATRCARLMAVCAGPPGTVAFMTFNVNQGGPEENQQFQQTIKAPLTCNAMGQWTYRGGVVTTVDCDATPLPGVTETTTTTVAPATPKITNNACQGCTAASINFLKKDPKRPDSFDATSEAQTNDPATGCARLTAVCDGPPGTVAFMQFNLNQGGPPPNPQTPQTIKAELMCSAMSKWTYYNREITAVDCQSAPTLPGRK